VQAALDNITTLSRLREDGYATMWDGNKYVQCRRLPDRSLRCEAAGTLMQSSLERVLTPERVVRLTALGWRLDPSFGNYVQTFPADAASSFVAEKILQVLGEAYEADIGELEVQSTSGRWRGQAPYLPSTSFGLTLNFRRRGSYVGDASAAEVSCAVICGTRHCASEYSLAAWERR